MSKEKAVEDNEMGGHAGHGTTDGQEFLTFRLGGEEYGVDILKVQEIRSYDTVTRLPQSPGYIKGVINLRGTIVPVIDMRLKFELENAEYNQYTVMIILNMGERVVGMVVDGVSDVITLSEDQIRPPPDFSGAMDSQCVTGLGAVDERMLILVDIEKLMDSDVLARVEEKAAAA